MVVLAHRHRALRGRVRRRRRRLRPGREHDAAARRQHGADDRGARHDRRAQEDRHDPGHAGRARPVEPLQRDEDRQVQPEATKGALTRVYVPNRADNTVSVIDPATMQVVDTFKVGLNPQHVVPSWDLKTLWVTNNAEGTHRRHAHADRPEDRASPGSRSPSTTRTTCTSRPTASRRSSSPRRASASTSSTRRRWRCRLARRPGLRRHQPRRLLHRRQVRDLHVRVPGQPREGRHRQPHGGRVPARSAAGRHAAGHPRARPTATPSTSPR